MKIIIIGNGVAGQTIAESCRKEKKDAEITIITKEKYPYYSRIYLPLYISNEKTIESLILRKKQWFADNNITLRLDTEIIDVNLQSKEVFVNNSRESLKYDTLFFATGSNARFIDYGHPDLQGVYALRNINDAESIKNYISDNNVSDIAILGGGLLGIELGYHLKELNLNVIICEISPYLLPRQLDEGSSRLLQKYLESKGLTIICGEKVIDLGGNKQVNKVIFESGKEISTQLILEQMGIIPEIDLAKKIGLKTEKGIVVNEFLQTSEDNIYAAGDCVQFNGLIWGIIPASLEQAKIAANHALGISTEPYLGSFWNTRLKIAGIKLSCFGSPPSTKMEEEELLENIQADHFICRKVVIEHNTLKSAILMGPGNDKYFLQNMGKEIKIDEVKENLNK